MSIEESRNCGCNCDCGCEEEHTVDCDLRREMIEQIRCYDFSINELALYLDTHPDDEKALCLHRKYCKQAKDLKDKYQKVYGPLTINYPCNKWRWLEMPWASFILEVNNYLSFLKNREMIATVREK